MRRFLLSWNIVACHRQQLGSVDASVGTVHSQIVERAGYEEINAPAMLANDVKSVSELIKEIEERELASFGGNADRRHPKHIFQVLALTALPY